MLLQQLYKRYPTLKITELHFAVDLPYWFSEIKVLPEKHLKHLKFKSTVYFDKRRKQSDGRVRNIDRFVIYDKTYKCLLSHPITRVELRLDREQLQDLNDSGNILIDEDLQIKLISKIKRRFQEITLKKGRKKIKDLLACPMEEEVVSAMQYIRGDDSLLEYLMKHRTEDVERSSRLFLNFILQCKKYKAYNAKPQLAPEIRPYFNALSIEEQDMINHTISNYNKYDREWYLNTLRKPDGIYRLTQSHKEQALYLSQLGDTQKEIAYRFGVSETRISRLFTRQGMGLRLMKDSHYANLFMKVIDEQ